MLHELVAHYGKRRDGGARPAANGSDRPRLVLCKVNVEEPGNDDLVTAYKVNAMPTLVWIANMKVMKRIEGANADKIQAITEELVN